jgi:integrase
MPHSGWVFRRADGRPGPNSPAVVSKVANTHLRDCGTDATLHQLRHRFASALYAQTQDLRLVQEMLGHASPETTAGYAAWNRTGASEAVNLLPAPQRLAAVTYG